MEARACSSAVELRTFNPGVVGSNPTGPSIAHPHVDSRRQSSTNLRLPTAQGRLSNRFWSPGLDVSAHHHLAVKAQLDNSRVSADSPIFGSMVSVGPLPTDSAISILLFSPALDNLQGMTVQALRANTPIPVERTQFGRTSVERIDSKSILTPTSGFMSQYKFTLNPYGGCSFGCEYCYAKFFAASSKRRETWGEWVSVKTNAGELMAKACRSRVLNAGDPVYMSSVTDPYQPIERRVRLTRAVLEAMLESGVQPRLTIQTRSPLVTRDIDLFQKFEKIRVNVTINTDSDEIRRRYEPWCPSIQIRLKAAADLAAAGVRIGVSISPMLPLRDSEAFGATLADLRADEYVTQYLKPGRSRFAAGTSAEALQKAREDGWGVLEYRQAREILANILGRERPLLEGAEGYAPA